MTYHTGVASVNDGTSRTRDGSRQWVGSIFSLTPPLLDNPPPLALSCLGTMDDLNDQIRQRRAKADALKARGVDPFGTRFEVADSAEALHRRHGASPREALEEARPSTAVGGRVVALRRFGKAAFAHLQDGSGRVQGYLKKIGRASCRERV